MPILDPVLDHPLTSGPSRDYSQEQNAPLYWQEPHQIRAMPAPALTLRKVQRPATHRITHDLRASLARVLVRDSNQNPDQAGTEAVTGIWSLNDPYAEGHLGEDTSAATGPGLTTLIGIGLALGAGFYMLKGRRG